MFIVSHYKSDYSWVKEYTNDFVVFNKDTLNVGYNIYDILTFITENYDELPDVCVFVKDNVLERHITKEEFDKVVHNKTFTPILTQNHKTDGVINYYKDGLYYERNDSWYLNSYTNKYFKSYKEFADEIGLPSPDYLGFAPGGCYIVPKENILKRSEAFYKKLLGYITYTQLPAEAHLIERSLYNMWA